MQLEFATFVKSCFCFDSAKLFWIVPRSTLHMSAWRRDASWCSTSTLRQSSSVCFFISIRSRHRRCSIANNTESLRDEFLFFSIDNDNFVMSLKTEKFHSPLQNSKITYFSYFFTIFIFFYIIFKNSIFMKISRKSENDEKKWKSDFHIFIVSLHLKK